MFKAVSSMQINLLHPKTYDSLELLLQQLLKSGGIVDILFDESRGYFIQAYTNKDITVTDYSFIANDIYYNFNQFILNIKDRNLILLQIQHPLFMDVTVVIYNIDTTYNYYSDSLHAVDSSVLVHEVLVSNCSAGGVIPRVALWLLTLTDKRSITDAQTLYVLNYMLSTDERIKCEYVYDYITRELAYEFYEKIIRNEIGDFAYGNSR